LPVGIQPAGEEDKIQGGDTDQLCYGCIVKLDTADTFGTCQYADDEKKRSV
jgi:hypothetical protein